VAVAGGSVSVLVELLIGNERFMTFLLASFFPSSAGSRGFVGSFCCSGGREMIVLRWLNTLFLFLFKEGRLKNPHP
jgi:hypothetical protein